MGKMVTFNESLYDYHQFLMYFGFENLYQTSSSNYICVFSNCVIKDKIRSLVHYIYLTSKN